MSTKYSELTNFPGLPEMPPEMVESLKAHYQGHLSDDGIASVLSCHAPMPTVDFVLRYLHRDGSNFRWRYALIKRKSGYWSEESTGGDPVPVRWFFGGRLRENETLWQAFQRVLTVETGLNVDEDIMFDGGIDGCWDPRPAVVNLHNPAYGERPDKHTVMHVYLVTIYHRSISKIILGPNEKDLEWYDAHEPNPGLPTPVEYTLQLLGCM